MQNRFIQLSLGVIAAGLILVVVKLYRPPMHVVHAPVTRSAVITPALRQPTSVNTEANRPPDRPTYRNPEEAKADSDLLDSADGERPFGIRQALGQHADINCRNRWGSTPLILAAYGQSTDKATDTHRPYPNCVKLLISRGANVNAQQEEGWTALMYASKGAVNYRLNWQTGRREMAENYESEGVQVIDLLCDAGADIDMINNDGDTALMLAAMNGEVGTARALLRHHARVDIKDHNGNTALDIAKRLSREPEWKPVRDNIIALLQQETTELSR